MNLNNINYTYKIFIEYKSILIAVLSLLFLIIICYKIIKGVVFRFDYEPFYLKSSHAIKFLNFIKNKKVRSSQLEDFFNQFKTNSFSYFDLYKKSIWFKKNNYKGLSKLHVIYKIPSRSHICIPDLIDLRFLKMLICNGVKVSVIILDVPYTTELKNFNSSWSGITKERIQAILGKKSSVYFLTDLLSKTPRESFKMVCADLIPLYAQGNKFKSKANTPRDIKIIEDISHTSKPLLLISLNNIIGKKDKVFVIQYHFRLKSWDEYYPVFKERLKIFDQQVCFISVNSLLDPCGDIFKPFVNDYNGVNNFNLTDSYEYICENLFHKKNNSWSIRTDYIIEICQLAFGKQISQTELKVKTLNHILPERQKLSTSNNQNIQDKNIISRYILLKEIRRLKRFSIFN